MSVMGAGPPTSDPTGSGTSSPPTTWAVTGSTGTSRPTRAAPSSWPLPLPTDPLSARGAHRDRAGQLQSPPVHQDRHPSPDASPAAGAASTAPPDPPALGHRAQLDARGVTRQRGGGSSSDSVCGLEVRDGASNIQSGQMDALRGMAWSPTSHCSGSRVDLDVDANPAPAPAKSTSAGTAW